MLVAKQDGSMQFCIDFLKVNTISKFDTSRVNELLDWDMFWDAKYISILNFTKGYWQILLTPEAKE